MKHFCYALALMIFLPLTGFGQTMMPDHVYPWPQYPLVQPYPVKDGMKLANESAASNLAPPAKDQIDINVDVVGGNNGVPYRLILQVGHFSEVVLEPEGIPLPLLHYSDTVYRNEYAVGGMPPGLFPAHQFGFGGITSPWPYHFKFDCQDLVNRPGGLPATWGAWQNKYYFAVRLETLTNHVFIGGQYVGSFWETADTVYLDPLPGSG